MNVRMRESRGQREARVLGLCMTGTAFVLLAGTAVLARFTGAAPSGIG